MESASSVVCPERTNTWGREAQYLSVKVSVSICRSSTLFKAHVHHSVSWLCAALIVVKAVKSQPTPAQPAPPKDPNLIEVTADGREIFSNNFLLPGRVYRLTISGTFRYGWRVSEDDWFDTAWGYADARYSGFANKRHPLYRPFEAKGGCLSPFLASKIKSVILTN